MTWSRGAYLKESNGKHLNIRQGRLLVITCPEDKDQKNCSTSMSSLRNDQHEPACRDGCRRGACKGVGADQACPSHHIHHHLIIIICQSSSSSSVHHHHVIRCKSHSSTSCSTSSASRYSILYRSCAGQYLWHRYRPCFDII